MIRAALLVLVAAAALAHAGPGRKAAPTRVERAAGDAFARAVTAEDRGDRVAAARLYIESFDLAPHPNTAFNAGRVHGELGWFQDAVLYYEIYLALAPAAPDRGAVEAAIEALRKRPATLTFRRMNTGTRIDLSGAYILVDGAVVSRPGQLKATKSDEVPLKLSLPPGHHTVDVVGDFTYFGDVVELSPGSKQELLLQGGTRLQGDVVIQGGEDLRGVIDGKELARRGERLPLTTGAHRMKILDRGRECPPITVETPKGDAVSYVHLAPKDPTRVPYAGPPFQCRPLVVTKQTLPF